MDGYSDGGTNAIDRQHDRIAERAHIAAVRLAAQQAERNRLRTYAAAQVRQAPRYSTELQRPDPKFLSEWKTVNVVLDNSRKNEDGEAHQIAIGESYREAQLIVDALNYGVRLQQAEGGF